MYPLKQSTAITIPFFAHDANGDGVTGIADGSWTKRISKGGGAFGAMTVTISEMENGWYALPLDTAHTDTLGVLTISLSATGAKRVNLQFRVSSRILDDLAFPATSGRSLAVDASGQVDVRAIANDAITAAVVADGAIDAGAIATGAITAAKFAAGAIDAAAIGTAAIDADAIATDAITAAKIAADAIGASELAADAVTEIQNGLATAAALAAVQADTDDIQARLPAALVGGRIDASVGAMAAGVVTAAAVATGAVDADALAADAVAEIADGVWDEAASGHVAAGSFGQRLQPLRAGTAGGGTPGSITLDGGADANDDFYKNALIVITGGTGAGQARTISGYTGASKIATITPNWVVTPDATSVFFILPAGAVAGASAPTASEVADAVWDETRSEHTMVGSFGQGVASVQGNVAGSVGSVAPGGIAAASFAAGAIDATAVADNAIDAGAFAQGAADKVWASAARTLTSFGTLVADVAAAVWGAGARTLTSFGTLVADIWAAATRSLTDKADFSLTSAERTAIADATLTRDLSTVTGEAARSPINALRKLMNRWRISGTTLTVYKEDDATPAYTQTVTPEVGATPISGLDTD